MRDDWRVLHLRSGRKGFRVGAGLEEMRDRFDGADGLEGV